MEDVERSGQPLTTITSENVKLIAAAVEENPHLSITEMRSVIETFHHGRFLLS